MDSFVLSNDRSPVDLCCSIALGLLTRFTNCHFWTVVGGQSPLPVVMPWRCCNGQFRIDTKVLYRRLLGCLMIGMVIMVIITSINSMLGTRRALMKNIARERLSQGLSADPNRVPCPIGYWSIDGHEPSGERAKIIKSKQTGLKIRRWPPTKAIPVLCTPCPHSMSTLNEGSTTIEHCIDAQLTSSMIWVTLLHPKDDNNDAPTNHPSLSISIGPVSMIQRSLSNTGPPLPPRHIDAFDTSDAEPSTTSQSAIWFDPLPGSLNRNGAYVLLGDTVWSTLLQSSNDQWISFSCWIRPSFSLTSNTNNNYNPQNNEHTVHYIIASGQAPLTNFINGRIDTDAMTDIWRLEMNRDTNLITLSLLTKQTKKSKGDDVIFTRLSTPANIFSSSNNEWIHVYWSTCVSGKTLTSPTVIGIDGTIVAQMELPRTNIISSTTRIALGGIAHLIDGANDINHDRTGTSLPWIGGIDDVSFYSTALTLSQLSAIAVSSASTPSSRLEGSSQHSLSLPVPVLQLLFPPPSSRHEITVMKRNIREFDDSYIVRISLVDIPRTGDIFNVSHLEWSPTHDIAFAHPRQSSPLSSIQLAPVLPWPPPMDDVALTLIDVNSKDYHRIPLWPKQLPINSIVDYSSGSPVTLQSVRYEAEWHPYDNGEWRVQAMIGYRHYDWMMHYQRSSKDGAWYTWQPLILYGPIVRIDQVLL
jgi:hypothetical protein